MALDFGGASSLMNPKGSMGLDPLALMSVFAKNPEQLIPLFASQGIPPPTGGTQMASAFPMAPNAAPDPYSKGGTQAPEVLPPLPSTFQPPSSSISLTPQQAPGVGALPQPIPASGAEPSQAWAGPDTSGAEPSDVWNQPSNAANPMSATPPSSLSAFFDPSLGSIPQTGTGGLSPTSLGGAAPGSSQGSPTAPGAPLSLAPPSPGPSTETPDAKSARMKNMVNALSGIKAPAAPEIQKISSPRPYNPNNMPAGNPMLQLIQQMLGNAQGAQPLHLNNLVK